MRELLRQGAIISIKIILYGLPFAIGMTFFVGVGDDRPLASLAKQTLMCGAGMTALSYISYFIMTRRENEDLDEKMDE